MHELSLALNVVEFLVKLADEQSLSKISAAFIEIGEMTHIDPRQLSYSLKMASEGTIAEGCKFYVKRGRVSIRCKGCGKASVLDAKLMISQYELRCPACGGVDIEIEKGKELVLKRVRGNKKQ
ncbi:MAG TPA: hydrogenase maturation nickel metallochaperone HypA [Candidatus Methanomethylicus sp.]|nr:hydrogenase maturation nickel metallochaperone HypA [Candidatus Methanomethylicus sp.]